MIRRMGMIAVLALLVAPGWGPIRVLPQAATADDAPAQVPDRMVDGEVMTYDVRVWKGWEGLGMQVGTAVFSDQAEDYRGRNTWKIHGSAVGGAFGYTMRTHVVSHLDRDTEGSVDYFLEQSGTEQRRKMLVFSGNGAHARVVYMKHKHCSLGDDCPDPNHFRTETHGGWFRRKRTVQVHCRDYDHCLLSSHCRWEQRSATDLPAQGNDMLSTLYRARALPLTVGGEPSRLLVVTDGDLWWVDIVTLEEQMVDVPAGRFRAKRIVLQPHPVDPGTSSRFEGLFGIKGSIEIWVDAQAGYPVRIQGVVPLGIDLNVDVALTARTVSEDPEAAHR